jgi:hypothetical protein
MLQKIKPNYVNWDTAIPSDISVEGVVNLGSTYVETLGNLLITSNSISIDLSTASVFNLVLDDDITNVDLINYPAVLGVISFVLVVESDGVAHSITWPNNFRWPDGEAPELTVENGKKDVFCFFTFDGGSNWQSIISGQNL